MVTKNRIFYFSKLDVHRDRLQDVTKNGHCLEGEAQFLYRVEIE